jgi:hypothetical protein
MVFTGLPSLHKHNAHDKYHTAVGYAISGGSRVQARCGAYERGGLATAALHTCTYSTCYAIAHESSQPIELQGLFF